MHKIKSIGMEHDVLAENAHLAEHNHERLVAQGIRSVDVMGSIGSGKTAMIIKMATQLKKKGVGVAVIAGDVTGEDDYKRFKDAGIEAYNVNTGKECHLESNLIERTLDKMDLEGIGFIFIENVGNLVCPADFPLGTDLTNGGDLGDRRGRYGAEAPDDLHLFRCGGPQQDRSGRLHGGRRGGAAGRTTPRSSSNRPLYLTSVKTGEGIEAVMKAIGASQ